MSERKTAVALSNIAKMVKEKLDVKVSEALVFEILKTYGEISVDLLNSGEAVPLHEVGIIKPTTIKGREYPNPRGGAKQFKPDRKGIRIDASLNLKRAFGRA
jgi:nucleoid DNA-binding protein